MPVCTLYVMGLFVRRVKTGSGAIAVQIVSKERGVRKILEHVGSAHSEADLVILMQTARARIRAHVEMQGQPELDVPLSRSDRPVAYAMLQHAYSRVLYDTLADVYARLGWTDPIY